MSVNSYQELRKHIGHKIACVCYGDKDTQNPDNIAIECETCNEVLQDYDFPTDGKFQCCTCEQYFNAEDMDMDDCCPWCHSGNFVLGCIDEPEPENPNWLDTRLQAVRVVSEILGTQELNLKEVAESMDLSLDELNGLLDRIQEEWEKITCNS